VTGSLHMGHALDHTLMDALTRRKRMQGYEVLWLPGMDHAGIATQSVVEKQLAVDGKTRRTSAASCSSTRSGLEARLGGTIGAQMRRLGDGVDWSRDRFTLDGGLSRVRTIFKRLFDAADLPRGAAGNWSPVLQTAVSDSSQIRGHRGRAGVVPLRLHRRQRTTPRGGHHPVETMLGDTAIAVHPDDERYRHLVGKTLPHPFSTGRSSSSPTITSTRIRHGRSQSHACTRPERLRDRPAT